MACRQLQNAFYGLSRFLAFAGQFDSMIDRIAQKMVQWSFEPIENVTVYGSGLADDLQPGGLSQRVSEISGHAGEHLDAVCKLPHAAVEDFLIQSRREAGETAIEYFEFLQMHAHGRLKGCDTIMKFIQPSCSPFAQRNVAHRLLEVVEISAESLMKLLHPQHFLGEGIKPPRPHQRFAGQSKQSIQVVRGHPQCPVRAPGGFCQGFRARRCRGNGLGKCGRPGN